MLAKLLIAWSLRALSVAIHAVGASGALRRSVTAPPSEGFPARARWLVGVAGWLIFLHLVQIALWALVYAFAGAMPDLQSALYFSAVTYTTTGYGDLTLSGPWRLVGGVESLTGILMCGLSTGVFVAVASRLVQTSADGRQAAIADEPAVTPSSGGRGQA